MKWLAMGLLLLVPVFGSEREQWYDFRGKPVEVPAAVTSQRTEAEWVPGWLARERERQARMGRKRWSYDRGWYGYGYANGGYWFRTSWPSCFARYRPRGWNGYFYRGAGSSRWCVRVNSPGLQINWRR